MQNRSFVSGAALGAFLTLCFGGLSVYAAGYIELSAGETVTVSGTTVACETGGGPAYAGSAFIPTNSTYVRGENVTVSIGASGDAVLTYGRTGRRVSLGGTIQGSPQIFIDQSGEARVLAVGSDGVYWTRTERAGWTQLGGNLLENPYVVFQGSDTYLLGRGTDQAIWYRTLGGTPWTSLGGTIVDQINVFTDRGEIVFQGTGSDGRYWERSLTRGWAPL